MSVGIRMPAVLDSGKVRSKRGVGGYFCGSGSKGEVIFLNTFILGGALLGSHFSADGRGWIEGRCSLG